MKPNLPVEEKEDQCFICPNCQEVFDCDGCLEDHIETYHSTPPQPALQSSSDLLPFKHGSEGTHGACQEMIEKYGDKVGCCQCNGHQCKSSSEDKEDWLNLVVGCNKDIAKDYFTKGEINFIKNLIRSEKEKMIEELDQELIKWWEDEFSEFSDIREYLNSLKKLIVKK